MSRWRGYVNWGNWNGIGIGEGNGRAGGYRSVVRLWEIYTA